MKRARTKKTSQGRGNKFVSYMKLSPKYALVNLGQGFPDKIKTVLRYSQVVTVTGTTGVIGNYLFRANGLYDPDYTSTGHQPMYYDQFVALYNHWVVTKSKITIKPVRNTSESTGCHVALLQNDDTTVLSTMQAMIEMGKAKYQMMDPRSGGKVMSQQFDARKVYGGNPLDHSQLQGSVGSDPSELTFFQISTQASDFASTVSVDVDVLIEYEVVFTELKDNESN